MIAEGRLRQYDGSPCQYSIDDKIEIAGRDPRNKKSLMLLMREAEQMFKKDIDRLWQARDVENSGILDMEQTRLFLLQVSKTVRSPDLKNQYNPSEFDKLFS